MAKQKFVINIGRQYGSGGLVIAKKLSKILKINYYDKTLLEIAAKKSGLSQEVFEKNDEKSFFKFLSHITCGMISAFGVTSNNDSCLINDSLFKIQSDIIKQLARKESCIFVGRSADYILRENKNAVNVFVCANMQNRIERITKKHNDTMSIEDVKKEIEQTDRQRKKYYEFYTNKKWGESTSYDLTINSSILGLDNTAKFIKDFVFQKLDSIN